MKTQLKIAILPLFLFTLALNAGVFAQKTVKQEIATAVNDWQKAYNAGNADALGAHYATDAVVTLADGSTLTGQDQVKEYFSTGFKSMSAEASVILSDVVDLGNGFAQTSGTYTIKSTMKEGGDTMQMSGNFSTLSRKEDGQWKIVRELVSEKPAASSTDRN
ncbi:MAG: nuclear transport factor 2 family protein [Saprospirales bacterium]|nr:nuclear transport factor 2 family protein [Saprospirales bacterium]